MLDTIEIIEGRKCPFDYYVKKNKYEQYKQTIIDGI